MQGRILRGAFLGVLGTLVVLWLPAAAPAATVWTVGNGGVAAPEDDDVAAFIESQGPFDRFLYLGDVYEDGTWDEFQTRYHPSYGRFREITSPTPGNHEWPNVTTGYDPYFGANAPQTNGGHWYSFDLAGWHLISLNSNEDTSATSPQVTWLGEDVARHPGDCTIAYFHRARYSASSEKAELEPVWQALEGHAVIVLGAHHHNYQRLKPERGMVQFVVGTGGQALHDGNATYPRLDRFDFTHHGALRLELGYGIATYAFVTKSGEVLDSGALTCRPHGPPPVDPAPSDPPADNPGGDRPGGPVGDPSPAPAAASIRVLSPRRGRTYSPRLRRFRGTSAAATGPVRVTLVRRARRRCFRLARRGFRRARCGTRRALPASGLDRWSLRLPRGTSLAPGAYRLTARVAGATGGAASATVRFRVAR